MIWFMAAGSLAAQENQGLFQLGASSSYDYGVNFEPVSKYQPLASGRVGMFSFDVHARIPLTKFIGIHPTYIWSFPMRDMIVSNLDGDYLPYGYGFDLPYDDNNPSYWYTDDYETLFSDAEISQQSFGAFLTLMPFRGFEIGSGMFIRNKLINVYNYTAYDEYYYYGSTGTQWDHYNWWDTWENPWPTSVNSYRFRSVTFPVIMKFDYPMGFINQGMSVVYWAGHDPYWSFRYSMGIAF